MRRKDTFHQLRVNAPAVRAPLPAHRRATHHLAGIATTNKDLYRAYLLKEQLRDGFVTKGVTGRRLLAGWLAWARSSRLSGFVKLANTITRYRQVILNTLDHGLSNARAEATNTHLRVLTRCSYGFHTPQALIAMAILTRGGLCPELPGRQLTN